MLNFIRWTLKRRLLTFPTPTVSFNEFIVVVTHRRNLSHHLNRNDARFIKLHTLLFELSTNQTAHIYINRSDLLWIIGSFTWRSTLFLYDLDRSFFKLSTVFSEIESTLFPEFFCLKYELLLALNNFVWLCLPSNGSSLDSQKDLTG